MMLMGSVAQAQPVVPGAGQAPPEGDADAARSSGVLAPQAPSTSCGYANRGALADGLELAVRGPGYTIPDPWRSRERRYGTAELVSLLREAAARVAADHPGAMLGIADLSQRGGGAVPGHRSHQSGRDVDLIYYAVDEEGAPIEPDATMPYYTSTGLAYYARSPSWNKNIRRRYFDVARNWALVKALLTSDEIAVEQLFVSNRIERWLIDHARSMGEPEEIIHAAQLALRRPSRGENHNDHLHLRIGCSEHDRLQGRCLDGTYKRRRRGAWHARVRCPREPSPLRSAATLSQLALEELVPGPAR